MSNSREKELESLVKSQQEQLNRYEKRLKDVVIAYKGLLKEKEALEAAISTSTQNDSSLHDPKASTNATTSVSATTTSNGKDDPENLKTQISTLMISLATLSGEKSRMEASFQSDKKKLRNELSEKDNSIKDLEKKYEDISRQTQFDMDTMKSKIIAEHEEREKESNNNLLMLRELQKLLSDERQLKESLEMQLNQIKNQIGTESANDNSNYNELLNELKEAKLTIRKLTQKAESKDNSENESVLQQLLSEMQDMKFKHSIALQNEQIKREKLRANMESRLSELSSTVGKYDRLRQQDQDSIIKLKEKLTKLNVEQFNECSNTNHEIDVPEAVEQIMKLKQIIQAKNLHSSNPVDTERLFEFPSKSDHLECMEKLEKCQTELEDYKQAVEVQKHHIRTLQDKVKVLNKNIEDQETELKYHTEKLNQAIKVERQKCIDSLNSLENEYRSKLDDVEQQLQKQRKRSLLLLEEKENEIKVLKTSFEIFVPKQITDKESNSTNDREGGGGMSFPLSENCHIIHYANEIARKDKEIASLRKSKYTAESVLRQALQDKLTSQEELHEKIQNLEGEVDRLERCKTREGANLEYLKNVIVSFLSTRSWEGKKHMINAIGTILQFTPSEMKTINSIIQKS